MPLVDVGGIECGVLSCRWLFVIPWIFETLLQGRLLIRAQIMSPIDNTIYSIGLLLALCALLLWKARRRRKP